ncbi:MAG: ATP-binding protein [Rhodospirillales bacterium 20-64-7]|nr:MAG: ATP-binding protein [Rhodospirillales bacterium 20-64-7]
MLLEIRDLMGTPGGPFNLTLETGECLVISGPSGIGKSLLLRMIADLDENTGTVLLNGVLRESMPAPAWRRQVMYVAAESGWWAETVREHLQPGDEAAALAPRLGLRAELLDAPVVQLSTGERQRMALLRAVLRKPAILLLDEPTSALDQASTLVVETLLRELAAAGTGIVLVSHNEQQAARIATRRAQMTQGALSAQMSQGALSAQTTQGALRDTEICE